MIQKHKVEHTDPRKHPLRPCKAITTEEDFFLGKSERQDEKKHYIDEVKLGVIILLDTEMTKVK